MHGLAPGKNGGKDNGKVWPCGCEVSGPDTCGRCAPHDTIGFWYAENQNKLRYAGLSAGGYGYGHRTEYPA
mgnify:CR=1 FL=1